MFCNSEGDTTFDECECQMGTGGRQICLKKLCDVDDNPIKCNPRCCMELNEDLTELVGGCQGESGAAEEQYACKELECNQSEECFCYTNHMSTDPSNNQVCAREDEEGNIVNCNPKCCNNGTGCPGECLNAYLIEPERIHEDIPIVIKGDIKFPTGGFLLALFLILLVISSTVVLVFRRILQIIKYMREKTRISQSL